MPAPTIDDYLTELTATTRSRTAPAAARAGLEHELSRWSRMDRDTSDDQRLHSLLQLGLWGARMQPARSWRATGATHESWITVGRRLVLTAVAVRDRHPGGDPLALPELALTVLAQYLLLAPYPTTALEARQ